MRLSDAITDLLALWVVLGVAAGLAVPGLAAGRGLVLPVLAVMIGAMALTLDVERFAKVQPGVLAGLLLASALVAPLAFGIATLLRLPTAMVLGFVVVGAVTPELTTPVMVHLADGDVPLATSTLVLAGFLSLVTVPGWALVLVGDAVPFSPVTMLRPLLLAVVVPTAVALAVRHRWRDAVAAHDDIYPAISALMVVIVITLVAAANAEVVLGGTLLVPVAGAAVALNAAGYAWGGLVGVRLDAAARRASVLSLGMRDFAVAAGVVLAAGLPEAAALPAVVFGLVEMVSSAGLARWMAGDDKKLPEG